MPAIKSILIMLPLSLLLTSASVKPLATRSVAMSTTSVNRLPSTGTYPFFKTQKMGFLKRMLLRKYLNKFKNSQQQTGDSVRADKMARASLILGIVAVILVFIPWYTLLFVIPLGILAIVYGKQAIKNGTTKETMAKVGKGLGLGALIGLAVEVLIATIIIVSWASWL